MTKEQIDLLIELVRVERRNLNNKLRNFYIDFEDRNQIKKEIKLCNETLKSLEGGK